MLSYSNNKNHSYIYTKEIIHKDSSEILLELFPKLSHPTQSRFHQFFNELNKLNPDYINNNSRSSKKLSYDKKRNKKLELNIYKIRNGIDKRTSLMIKNIPKGIDEINVVKWLIQLAKLNYVFVPKDEFSNQILGFAFINVCNYTDILEILKKLSIFETNNKQQKKIEVIYSYKQGLKSLTKSFGVSHLFLY